MMSKFVVRVLSMAQKEGKDFTPPVCACPFL